MNREISFKAKRIDSGKWVEGDLVHSVYKINDTCVGKYGSDVGMHQTDPATVCQFTGMVDKNGVKIWENDIVKWENWSAEYTSIVRFGEYTQDGSGGEYEPKRCYGIYAETVHAKPLFGSTEVFLPEYDKRISILEIEEDLISIGNIFDNSDLLKGGD